MGARRLTNERGIALAVAIFALVVIGALVAGTFFVGRVEHQSGQNTVYAAQAAEAADAGLSDAIATGQAMLYNPMAIGATVDLGSITLADSVTSSRQVTRLTESLFLVQSLGRRSDASGNLLATRTVGSLSRLNRPDISVKAALSAIGRVTVTGNSTVDGHDLTPPAWTLDPDLDCPPEEDVTGIRYTDPQAAETRADARERLADPRRLGPGGGERLLRLDRDPL